MDLKHFLNGIVLLLGLASAFSGTWSCVSTKGSMRGTDKTVVISLQKLSCQSSGQAVVRALRQRKGIRRVQFDKHKVEVTVQYNPAQTGESSIQKAVQGTGYQWIVGAGKGFYIPHVKFKREMDVRWLAKKGEDVEIKSHLVPGKVTVFDFYAEWCGPCHEVDREMFCLLKDNQDIALRKLNIVDWKKPLAQRYLTHASSLPYVIVYSRKGRLIRKIAGLKLKKLNEAIRQGRHR